jgi:hypothetical protein
VGSGDCEESQRVDPSCCVRGAGLDASSRGNDLIAGRLAAAAHLGREGGKPPSGVVLPTILVETASLTEAGARARRSVPPGLVKWRLIHVVVGESTRHRWGGFLPRHQRAAHMGRVSGGPSSGVVLLAVPVETAPLTETGARARRSVPPGLVEWRLIRGVAGEGTRHRWGGSPRGAVCSSRWSGRRWSAFLRGTSSLASARSCSCLPCCRSPIAFSADPRHRRLRRRASAVGLMHLHFTPD